MHPIFSVGLAVVIYPDALFNHRVSLDGYKLHQLKVRSFLTDGFCLLIFVIRYDISIPYPSLRLIGVRFAKPPIDFMP